MRNWTPIDALKLVNIDISLNILHLLQHCLPFSLSLFDYQPVVFFYLGELLIKCLFICLTSMDKNINSIFNLHEIRIIFCLRFEIVWLRIVDALDFFSFLDVKVKQSIFPCLIQKIMTPQHHLTSWKHALFLGLSIMKISFVQTFFTEMVLAFLTEFHDHVF